MNSLSRDGLDISADVAKLTYLSSVVSAYIDARYYQERIAIARKNLASRRETLELTRLQLEAGAASRLDVVQSEGLVNSTLAEIPGLEISFRQSVHRISLLLGLPATTLLADLQKGAAQPYARRGVNAGVPADLIRNRPDIRAAQARLHRLDAEPELVPIQRHARFESKGVASGETAGHKPERLARGRQCGPQRGRVLDGRVELESVFARVARPRHHEVVAREGA